jgi:hypothetical protein
MTQPTSESESHAVTIAAAQDAFAKHMVECYGANWKISVQDIMWLRMQRSFLAGMLAGVALAKGNTSNVEHHKVPASANAGHTKHSDERRGQDP